jgi:hypothetical protein
MAFLLNANTAVIALLVCILIVYLEHTTANKCIQNTTNPVHDGIKDVVPVSTEPRGGYSTSYSSRSLEQVDSNGPASRTTSWAIVALVFRFENLTNKRNQLIAKYVKSVYSSNRNITIIMFSERKFTAEQIEEWKSDFNGTNTAFQFVDTTRHGFQGTREPFGYRYMCKFFMLDIYEHLQSYDYYMRCDTDCLLLKIDYDVVGWFESKDMQYGWLGSGVESHVPTAETMPPFVKNYTIQCGIEPTALGDRPLESPDHYYNNFHLGRTSFFLQLDVQHFLRAVLDSGYIVSHRWGDAVVQAYAVRIFGDPNRCSKVPANMEYVHGSHKLKVVNGEGQKVVGIVNHVLYSGEYPS